MSRAPADILPRWTSYVVTKLGGRDPLGLSRLSQYLTDHVLTGLVINTDRARYYSLYCWILWHCEQCHPAAAWAVFQQAYQRREAAVAYASLLANEAASVVGSRAVLAHLQRDGEELDTQFKVLGCGSIATA